MLRTIKCILALIALCGAVVSSPSSAHAGTLTHFSCQLPDGVPTRVNNGWAVVERGRAHAQVQCDGVGINLGLSAAAEHNNGDRAEVVYRAPVDAGIAGVVFPRRTRGLSHSGVGGSPSPDLNFYDLLVDGRRIDTCSPFASSPTGGSQCPSGLDGVYVAATTDVRELTAVIGCGFAPHHVCPQDRSQVSAQVHIPWARVTLADSSAPQLGNVGGPLAADGRHHGVESLSFSVTDRGTGVYRGVIEVDGKPVYRQVVDSNVVGGRTRCRDATPGDADPYQFVDSVPCKLSVSSDVTLDTTTVADGVREVRVIVEDATGNQTTVLGARRMTVDNVPSPDDPACRNGVDDDLDGLVDAADSGCAGGEDSDEGPLPTVPSGPPAQPTAPVTSAQPVQPAQPAQASQVPSASPGGVGATSLAAGRGAPNGDRPADDARLTAAFSPNGSELLTTRFGTRAVVRGKLVDGRGTPIANARVELLARNASPGSALVDKGGARTRTDGTWTMILPRDVSSRTLSFRYRSHLGDVKPVAEVALTLRVRAGVTLAVTPKNASSRGSIRISGRLLGGPLPARGKLVELQARGKGGGRWISFRTVRSDARGRYSTNYRFRNTVGPVTYVFRARAREEAAYPFLTGTSRVVSVRVR